MFLELFVAFIERNINVSVRLGQLLKIITVLTILSDLKNKKKRLKVDIGKQQRLKTFSEIRANCRAEHPEFPT